MQEPMKKTSILLLSALTLLACSGRRDARTDGVDSVAVQAEERHPDTAATVVTEEPADTVPAWMTAFPATAQDDSIRPVMRWRFSLADGAAPLILRSDIVTSHCIEMPLEASISRKLPDFIPETLYNPNMSDT